MASLAAKSRMTATIQAVLTRADGTREIRDVVQSVEHPWRRWQIWWWQKVLRRPVPFRGRIPGFKFF